MIALWVLAGILGALLLALSVPLDVTFVIDTTAPRPARVRLAWLWGTLGGEPGGGKRKPERPPKKARPRRPFHALALVNTPGFMSRTLAFIRRLLERLHARVQLQVELGLADPAATGELFGASQLLARALPAPAFELAVHPHFHDERLELRGRGELHAVPLVIVADVVRFTLAPVTLRALRRGFSARP